MMNSIRFVNSISAAVNLSMKPKLGVEDPVDVSLTSVLAGRCPIHAALEICDGCRGVFRARQTAFCSSFAGGISSWLRSHRAHRSPSLELFRTDQP
jgi:hypothetical protein